MTIKTSLGSTAAAALVCVAALGACGGGGGGAGVGGKLSAAKSATMCSDYTHVVSLDNSDAGGSIAFYTQMRDLYKKLQGEAPSSLHGDLQTLIDDEQQLVNNGTDSSSQNDAATAAAQHVDSVLGPACNATSGSGASATTGDGQQPSEATSEPDATSAPDASASGVADFCRDYAEAANDYAQSGGDITDPSYSAFVNALVKAKMEAPDAVRDDVSYMAQQAQQANANTSIDLTQYSLRVNAWMSSNCPASTSTTTGDSGTGSTGDGTTCVTDDLGSCTP